MTVAAAAEIGLTLVDHRPLPYALPPVLRASNGAGLIPPDDRKYGALLVGGQGSGKSAAMLRQYLGDLHDDHAAVVVLDPKSELSRLCLALTPPDCPKRVWFLDLGHPLVGMSPLRLTGHDPLPLQATAVADNVVAALLDINENQIFQSSRRYLYHAVIGALALAAKQDRRAKFEDVYTCCCPRKPTSATPSTRPAPTPPTSTRPPSSSAPNCSRTSSSPAAPPPSGSTRRATRSACSPACPPCGASSTTPATSRWATSSTPATS